MIDRGRGSFTKTIPGVVARGHQVLTLYVSVAHVRSDDEPAPCTGFGGEICGVGAVVEEHALVVVRLTGPEQVRDPGRLSPPTIGRSRAVSA